MSSLLSDDGIISIGRGMDADFLKGMRAFAESTAGLRGDKLWFRKGTDEERANSRDLMDAPAGIFLLSKVFSLLSALLVGDVTAADVEIACEEKFDDLALD